MNKNLITEVYKKMIEHEKNVPRRVHHFIKVNSFAKMIAEIEGVDDESKFIIDVASLMHDIGIRPALEKYNSSAGKYQEELGSIMAEPILNELGFKKEHIERICFLIAHHHTYNMIDGIDYQILIEADFLVNVYEDMLSDDAIENFKNKIFKTSAGLNMLENMYQNGDWSNM